MSNVNYTATIEIPKGSDRRIHMKHDQSGFIDLGLLKDKIPVNNGIMPVHYGYINDTLNLVEGDEVDTIIFSKNEYSTGDVINIHIAGMLVREDGDNKVVSYDDTIKDFEFEKIPAEEQDLILKFICHSSPLISTQNTPKTLEYLKASQSFNKTKLS